MQHQHNVIRPANQINRTQPTFKFNSSDFWAQGINVGLAFRF